MADETKDDKKGEATVDGRELLRIVVWTTALVAIGALAFMAWEAYRANEAAKRANLGVVDVRSSPVERAPAPGADASEPAAADQGL